LTPKVEDSSDSVFLLFKTPRPEKSAKSHDPLFGFSSEINDIFTGKNDSVHEDFFTGRNFRTDTNFEFRIDPKSNKIRRRSYSHQIGKPSFKRC
jgi:hypothetical protein